MTTTLPPGTEKLSKAEKDFLRRAAADGSARAHIGRQLAMAKRLASHGLLFRSTVKRSFQTNSVFAITTLGRTVIGGTYQ